MRTDTERINDTTFTVLDLGKVPYKTIVELLEYDVIHNVLKFFVQDDTPTEKSLWDTGNKADLEVKQHTLENGELYTKIYVNTTLILHKRIDVDSHINQMLKKIELQQEKKQENEEEDENDGLIELKQIINCVSKCGYTYDGESKSRGWHHYKVAEFEKDIRYSEKSGNYINDAHIRVMIEYSLGFNEKNQDDYDKELDDYKEYDYSKYDPFMQKLVNQIIGEDSDDY
jgi:hypothetical protein